MAPSGNQLGLNPDELAFYFQSDVGIEAGELGAFLQRAAVVARRAGAEIRVVGVEPGSLLVKLRAIKKSQIYKNAKKEFINKPLTSSAQIAGVVGTATAMVVAVSAAISAAFSDPDPTPLAKSGAEVVEKCSVVEINLITNNSVTTLMNEEIARDVRQRERAQPQRRLAGPDEVRALSHDAEQGNLAGTVVDFHGQLHFQPDGFKFWVPIDLSGSTILDLAVPAHYRVTGELILDRGRPDSLQILRAKRTP